MCAVSDVRCLASASSRAWDPLLNSLEIELALSLIEEILTRQEVDLMTELLLEEILKSVSDLELIGNEQLPMLTISAFVRLKLLRGFKLSRMLEDACELLDKTAVLRFVRERIVHWIKQYCAR
jgi:hypothetical protein